MSTNKKKKAFITGIAGQDGPYLAELLLSKNYDVHGLVRPESPDLADKLIDLDKYGKVFLVYGDIRDDSSVRKILEEIRPDEVYNLAAQSHIPTSFGRPEETFEINYRGAGGIIKGAMEANPKVRIYQASTCEMFGSSPPPQNEKTPFNPLSPYAQSKLKAHQDFVVGFREKYGLFVCSGILFHHESPRRPEKFVSRKITSSLVKIREGRQKLLELGNLSAKIDWGFAGDYVRAMWLMLEQDEPEDYVIATGESHTVRDFATTAARLLGINLAWEGEGLEEIGKDERGKIIVRVNKEFYRPTEPNSFLGDAAKARKQFGWSPSVNFENLIKILIESDGKVA